MPRFDLNLVRTFVAIHETRSVTLAAERLELTQSSVSHALGRLRAAYGDHLFVRHVKGLEPTSLAQQLYERFSVMLAGIDETLESREAFDAARTTRRLRVGMSDMALLAFGHRVAWGLLQAAPRAEVQLMQITDAVLDDLVVGRIDALVGNLPALASATRSELLFRETYACLLADGHPQAQAGLSLEQFAAARHVLLSTPTPGNQLIDSALAAHGLKRRIAVRTPHFADVAALVAGSDLVAVLPARLARMHESRGGLRVVPLPVDLPAFEMRLYWHMRHAASPAHAWLVEQVTRLLHEE